MKFIEDKLEALDTYFASRKEGEKWLVILGVAGIIAYVAYAALLPYSEKMYRESEADKKSIEKKLKDNKTYLASITVDGDRNYYIKKYSTDIKQKNRQIIQITENIKFINNSLNKLSDMLFNQKSWSKFLNSITDRAEVQNVKVEYIRNKYANSKGNFGYVLEIEVGCKGDYQSIVKFMNEIEQNRLVTDIYGTKLSLDKKSSDIIADINISVWGINN